MSTQNEITELIAEIATKHGIALDRNDPILILNTINQRLMSNSAKSQQQILHSFKQDLEMTSHRWASEAKRKAEDILNAALAAGKKQLTEQVTDVSKDTTEAVKREISDITKKFNASVKDIRRLVYLAIAGSFITLVSATIVLFTKI